MLEKVCGEGYYWTLKRRKYVLFDISTQFICFSPLTFTSSDIVLMYAIKYDNVPLVINVSGRFDMSKSPKSTLLFPV